MAAEEKPKIFEGAKDIILSLGVTVIAMLLVVGATGLCTINPETKPGPIQNVDAKTFLEMEARATGTVIREPKMPEGWSPTAARRSAVAGENAAVVSWLTADEGYIESTQTKVSAEEAEKGYDSNYRAKQSEREVAGLKVKVLESEDADVRPLWIADLGDARLILSGSAADADYETALKAFAEAPVLHHSEDGSAESAPSGLPAPTN
ncbi:DUF4245 domain-containing protein [Corynebacterium striatum]